MDAGEVSIGKAPGEEMAMLEIRNGRPLWRCPGAKHTFIGRVLLFGYIFDSDKQNPLRFTVDKAEGYVYLNGKGVVTMPDGSTRALPPPKVDQVKK